MDEKKRTLIETFLPVEEITEEAKKEKRGTAKPKTFEMHYWWTRKPLIASRAAVLGSLLPSNYDIDKFKSYLGLNKQKRAHNYGLTPSQLSSLKNDYQKIWDSDDLTILDPFGGGGSIPFEAMRMGVSSKSNDYNPLAHLIQKATLEYPHKYGLELYDEVERGLEWIFNKTKDELIDYYPTNSGKNSVAYVWAWMVKCSKCGFDTPLVGQWSLVKKNKNLFINPTIDSDKLSFEIMNGKTVPQGTCSDAKGKCLSCGSIISNLHIQKDILEREKEMLLSVILKESTNCEYVLPSDDDILAIEKAKEAVIKNMDYWIKEDLIPLEVMPETNDVRSQKYLKYWYKFLNPRQLLLCVTLTKNIRLYSTEIKDFEPGLKKAVMTYLSFVLGKNLDYNCRSTRWAGSLEVISSTMGRRGMSMMWNHAEVNPFEKSSGTLQSINKSILAGLKYSINSLRESGNIEIQNSSITNLNGKYKLIITDPPYFDDVQYAELSQFFYNWEKKALKGIYDLGDVPSSEDLSVGGNRNKNYFQRLFYISCKKMHDLLEDDGLLVLFFAHSEVDAWDFVVSSLQKSNFRVTATWPVHTEFTNNPHARGNASIMSSIIIAARKRKIEKTGFIEEIQDEIESHLKKRLEEFWNYGLLGADLTVSAMGATLDIITQYSEIKSYTGEMNVKDILELVQKYVSEYILGKHLKNSSSLDAQTSFYLYSRLSGMGGMPFDTANLVSKSLNVNLKQFESDGQIESIKTGTSKGIRILKYNEREVNRKLSLIDVVQYSMIVFERSGISEVIKEIDESPFGREEVMNVLEGLLSLPAEDIERKAAQRIVDQMGKYTPAKSGQRSLVDDY